MAPCSFVDNFHCAFDRICILPCNLLHYCVICIIFCSVRVTLTSPTPFPDNGSSTFLHSRISSPWKMVSYFVMIFLPLWKFLTMNLTHISDAFSLIRQKWVWKWFYSTAEIDSSPFLWLMQPTWRKVMKIWSYCWESLSMKNLIGSYVVISTLWHCYWECNWGAQSTDVSYVSETPSARKMTM